MYYFHRKIHDDSFESSPANRIREKLIFSNTPTTEIIYIYKKKKWKKPKFNFTKIDESKIDPSEYVEVCTFKKKKRKKIEW